MKSTVGFVLVLTALAGASAVRPAPGESTINVKRQIGVSIIGTSNVPLPTAGSPATALITAGSSSNLSNSSSNFDNFGSNYNNSVSNTNNLNGNNSSDSNSNNNSSNNSDTYSGNDNNNVTDISKSAEQDLRVLQFALLLENLESTFYQQLLHTFSQEDWSRVGLTAPQIRAMEEVITLIATDEETHVKFLTDSITSLGGSTISPCSLNFDSALTDPLTALSTARTLEIVGVGAYLGAAALISSPQILTAAATIVTVESRHSTSLNVVLGEVPISSAFDLALGPASVLSNAWGFLEGCTANDLGFTMFEPLAAIDIHTGTSVFKPGSTLAFASAVELDSNNMFCQHLLAGVAQAIVIPLSQCDVPSGTEGVVATFITSSGEPLSADLLQFDSSIVVAGPVILFVDSDTSQFGSIFSPLGELEIGSSQIGLLSIPEFNTGTLVIESFMIQQVVIQKSVVVLVDSNGSKEAQTYNLGRPRLSNNGGGSEGAASASSSGTSISPSGSANSSASIINSAQLAETTNRNSDRRRRRAAWRD